MIDSELVDSQGIVGPAVLNNEIIHDFQWGHEKSLFLCE